MAISFSEHGIWYALTPPHISAPKEQLPPSLIGRFAVSFVTFMKFAHLIFCIAEILFVFDVSSAFDNGDSVSSMFLFGFGMVFIGSQIRFACYRALGRLFTFEMAIRDGHKLITTGPYAYVRHPAYSGLLMTMYGEAILQASPGTWFNALGLRDTFAGKLYLVILILPMFLLTYSSTIRGIREDKILKEEFGQQWVEWADKTKYRMLPWVY